MGFAILWIMFFHSDISIENAALRTFQQLGYGGVDLFIFASGIGCRYSLDKNPEPLAFLKRRAVRLLPTWWLFLIVWWFLQNQQGLDLPPRSFLGNFFAVQAFVDWHFCFNWYISALPFLYILAPYLHSLIKNASVRRFFAIEFVLLALTVPFLNQDYLVLMTRLPIFAAGFFVAELAERGTSIDRRAAIGLLGATTLGFAFLIACKHFLAEMTLSIYGLWWYPFLPITPGLCFGLSFALSRLPRLDRALSTLGALSFEIYLVHILLLNIVNHSAQLDNIHRLALLPSVLIASLGLRRLRNFLTERFF